MRGWRPHELVTTFRLGVALLLVMVVASITLPAALAQGLDDLPWLRSRTPVSVPSGTPTIAVLLPLSGKHQRMGKDVQNALEMATFDNESTQLDVRFFDTASSPEIAAQKAQEAISQGAQVILGPVTSAETKTVAAAVKSSGIPVISLSNDISLADAHTLIFGLIPEMAIQQTLDYAVQNNIYLGYAILTENALADTMSRALQVHAQNNRYTIPQIVRFTDVSAALNQLLTDVQASYAKTPGPGKLAGLIVPEAGFASETVLKRIAHMDTQGVLYRVAGSSLWVDNPPKIAEAEGSFFAALSPAITDSFNERYRSLYNSTPHQVALVGYDAMQLVFYFAQQNAVANLSAQGLLESGDFIGLMGHYHVCPSGAVVRGLSVLGVSGSRVVELQPAPDNLSRMVRDHCAF